MAFPLPPLSLSDGQILVEALATQAFAASGILEAGRKRLAVVGVCTVSCLAAFGGGTLRDALLDRRPFFWVEHPAWLWIVLALGAGAMWALRARHIEPTRRAIQWPDALGLGLFTAGGTQIALALRSPAIVAVLMGTITAVFGGVLRDIVCNEIPSAFRDRRPYAVCAFAGGWCVVVAEQLALPGWGGLLTGASTPARCAAWPCATTGGSATGTRTWTACRATATRNDASAGPPAPPCRWRHLGRRANPADRRSPWR